MEKIKTKKIKVQIKGITPLLMHRIIPDELDNTGARNTTKPDDRKEYARQHAYWKDGEIDGELCIPARCIRAAMMKASTAYRIKGRYLSTMLQGITEISPEEIGLGKKTYDVDERAVTIKSSKIIRARAKVFPWKADFDLDYLDEYLKDSKILYKVIKDAGFLKGLMDFRPQKKGNFGKFEITKWEEN